MKPPQSLFGDDPEARQEAWRTEQEKIAAEAAKHRNYTFYFCGKVKHTDWRHSILDLRDVSYPLDSYRLGQVTILSNELGPGLHYCGPFFVGCDHGCYHGPNSHGAAADTGGYDDGAFDDEQRVPSRHKDWQTEIAFNCQISIRAADIIFAWLDDLTAFGTFAGAASWAAL
jgi:hypothetical protein